jgi:ubiquinone biosynthesis protein COQ9
MAEDTQTIRDKIIEQALPGVPFDGWTLEHLEKAAMAAGYQPAMVRAVFPGGLGDALDHFADLMDRRMLAALGKVNVEDLRVRDRIRTAVLARLEALRPHREAERLALTYWSFPFRHLRAGKIAWRTADRIWDWVGDDSTDYNRYTKRGLLSGVLASTLLAWLDNEESAPAFLDRRIENVMQWGRFLGKFRRAG